MAYLTCTDLLAEFRADWEAALCPNVEDFMGRCEPGERDSLADLICEYLVVAPTPPYSPVQRRRMMEKVQPLVDRVVNDPAWIAQNDQLQAAWRDRPWLAKRWVRMRSRVGMWRLRLRVRRQPKPWE